MPTDIERADVQRLVRQGGQLIEVLAAREYDQLHIQGAISIPLNKLSRQVAEERLRRDAPIITYCFDRQ